MYRYHTLSADKTLPNIQEKTSHQPSLFSFGWYCWQRAKLATKGRDRDREEEEVVGKGGREMDQ